MNKSACMPDRTLDARGLECPEPVFCVARELAKMQARQVLEVRADDPLAPLDLRVYCERSGHALLDVAESADGSVIRIRRRSD